MTPARPARPGPSPAEVRVLGTAEDGYIVTPVTPQLAARIDAASPGKAASPDKEARCGSASAT